MSGVVCVVCPFADDEKLKNVVCPFADDEKYMCIGAHDSPWTCMIIPHVSFVLSCLTWSFMPLHSEIYQGAIQRSAETVGWKRLEISHHFSITPSRPLHYIVVQLCGSDHQENR